jgi:hypothetical protein
MTRRHPSGMTNAHPPRLQAPRPMETEPRVYAAELLGTFVLVFVGTSVVAPAPEAPAAPIAEVLGEDPERGR